MSGGFAEERATGVNLSLERATTINGQRSTKVGVVGTKQERGSNWKTEDGRGKKQEARSKRGKKKEGILRNRGRDGVWAQQHGPNRDGGGRGEEGEDNRRPR